jgi:phosphomannomutase
MLENFVLFGTDGWRGRIGREFTFDIARAVIEAMGAWTAARENSDPGNPHEIVIVFDTRFLSPEFALEAAETLARKGFRVLLSDRPVPTPCASYHVKTRGLRGGIAITASHNPSPWNGVKYKSFFGGSAPPSTYQAIHDCLGRHVPDTAGGSVEILDLETPYGDGIGSVVDLDAIRRAGIRILWDGMHGSSGNLLEKIVGKEGATRVTTVRGERNPLFGGVNPEPIPLNMQASLDVLHSGDFDILLASDGDGDRLGVFDERGRFINPHRILAFLADRFWKSGRISGGVGKTFSTSLIVERVCKKLEAPLVTTPIGFKYLAEKMLTGEIGIGGEESGGLGVSFYLPERDGVFTGLLVLEAIAHSGLSFRRLMEIQEEEHGLFYYDRRDRHGAPGALLRLVEGLKAAPPTEFAGETVTGTSCLDGFKLQFGERGWLLFRLSGTEPIIRLYAEHEEARSVNVLLDAAEALVNEAA